MTPTLRVPLLLELLSRASAPLRGLAAVLLVCVSMPATAEGGGLGDIWICVDPDTSAKTFTSNPRGMRQCRRVEPAASTSTAKPVSASSTSPTTPATRPTSRTAPAQIASAEQRQRESDRKQILQDELASENKKYAELQREFNLGAPIRLPGETDDAKYRDRKQRLSQDIERSRVNISSLERELGRL